MQNNKKRSTALSVKKPNWMSLDEENPIFQKNMNNLALAMKNQAIADFRKEKIKGGRTILSREDTYELRRLEQSSPTSFLGNIKSTALGDRGMPAGAASTDYLKTEGKPATNEGGNSNNLSGNSNNLSGNSNNLGGNSNNLGQKSKGKGNKLPDSPALTQLQSKHRKLLKRIRRMSKKSLKLISTPPRPLAPYQYSGSTQYQPSAAMISTTQSQGLGGTILS